VTSLNQHLGKSLRTTSIRIAAAPEPMYLKLSVLEMVGITEAGAVLKTLE
jgi:hypothetical protein